MKPGVDEEEAKGMGTEEEDGKVGFTVTEGQVSARREMRMRGRRGGQKGNRLSSAVGCSQTCLNLNQTHVYL